MGVPAVLAARLAPRFVDRGVRVNEATDEAVRTNLAALDFLSLRRFSLGALTIGAV